MRNILSNVKAQSQKIFGATVDLLTEDGLVNKSLDGAIGKVGAKHKKSYDATAKILNQRDKSMMNQVRDSAKARNPKDMSILGKKLTKEQVSSTGDIVSNRVAEEFPGIGSGSTKMNESYGKYLRKTRGAIAMNSIGQGAKNYYYNPLKDGIGAIGETGFKENTDLHKGLTRVGVTAAGSMLTVGAVKGVSNLLSDDDQTDR